MTQVVLTKLKILLAPAPADEKINIVFTEAPAAQKLLDLISSTAMSVEIHDNMNGECVGVHACVLGVLCWRNLEKFFLSFGERYTGL